LGATYLARGFYAQAESTCSHALAILEKVSPHDYASLIQTLNTYTLLLVKTNRKTEAELFETRAMVYKAKLLENINKK
jgi:hypothetical protein